MPNLIQGTTRAAILAETVTALTGVVPVGSIYTSRSDVLAPAECPAITLTMDRESDALQLDGQTGLCRPYLDRSCDLVIGCHVSSSADTTTDAALNTLVEATRAALFGSLTWLAAANQITASIADYYVGSGEGGEYTAAARLTVSITYSVQYG